MIRAERACSKPVVAFGLTTYSFEKIPFGREQDESRTTARDGLGAMSEFSRRVRRICGNCLRTNFVRRNFENAESVPFSIFPSPKTSRAGGGGRWHSSGARKITGTCKPDKDATRVLGYYVRHNVTYDVVHARALRALFIIGRGQ